jgi:hypothetical protein
MTKTLICLLSEQHVPNLLSVHHLKPDNLILIESSGMQKKHSSENFCDALKFGNPNVQCGIVRIDGSESDFQTCRTTFNGILQKSPPDMEWIINLTGGLKPMAIAAYETFSSVARRRFIYTDHQTPKVIGDFLTGEKEICQYTLSIEEFLSGYGFEYSKKIQDVEAAQTWAKKHRKAAFSMAKHAMDIRCWGKNALERERERVNTFMKLKTGKTADLELADLAPTVADVRKVFCAEFDLKEKDGSLMGKIDKYTAKFIDGGWLENFIWLILNDHREELDVTEVRLGLQIRGKKENTSENELDVSLMRNYAFEFIECKSGSQEHDKKGEIFYRIEAVRNSPGALRSKTYFVSNSHTFSEDGDTLKSEALKQRAETYNCTPILGKAIENMANNPNADTIKRIFGW